MQLRIGRSLRIIAFSAAAESGAKFLCGSLNLMHGMYAMPLVIVIGPAKQAISSVKQPDRAGGASGRSEDAGCDCCCLFLFANGGSRVFVQRGH